MFKAVGVLLLSAAAIAVTPDVHAGTIFSTLGRSSTYALGPPLVVGAGCSPLCDQAAAFTVPVGPDFQLTQIDIALEYLQSGTNGAIVKLFTDSGGSPDALVPSATWALSELPSSLQTSIQLSQTITGISGITLAGGTQYWLAASSTGRMGWAFNVVRQSGQVATSWTGGANWGVGTYSALAFDLLGDTLQTPEPRMLVFLGIGLLSIFAAGRGRAARRQFKE